MKKTSLAIVVASICVVGARAHAEIPFLPGPAFYTGAQPWGSVVGDFDNDGHLDIAMANYDQPGYATVLLGDGHGAFEYASSPTVGKAANGIAAGHFDADGNLDLVISSISNDASDIVSVLLGNGDGTFAPAVEYDVGAMPNFVAVADLNGDGKADIVTENTNSQTVSVLLGNGDGTFMDRVDYSLGLNPTNIAIADIDDDGKLDVIVSANSFFASFAVLRGKGDGTFFFPTYGGTGGALYFDIALADFNRDGHKDVALLDRPGGRVVVYLAYGTGGFGAMIPVPADSDINSIAAADLYGDGHIEVLSSGGSGPRIFQARDDGTFDNTGSFPESGGGASVVIADFNEDGMLDILSPNYYLSSSSVLLNQTIMRSGFD